MYSIYEAPRLSSIKDGGLVDTRNGFSTLNRSIEKMICLAGEEISRQQKLGKRATVESMNFDGWFVVRVANTNLVLKQWVVKI